MRRLPPPTLNEAEVLDACINDSATPQLAGSYAASRAAILGCATQYSEQAAQFTLHSLPGCNRGHDDQVIVNDLTKGDLNRLYSKGMLNGVSARTYYDQILASAPLGKCPYCRFGHAETLDHFLPKSRYPAYAVLPRNLVPACSRCNTGKGSGLLTAEKEISHPYFESEQIELDTWLVAQVVPTNPVTATFSVIPPANWSADLSRRVRNYFIELDLASGYSVEAASELVSVSAYLRVLPSADSRRQHLQRVAAQERGIAKNGWKAALYVALADSAWYSDVGYTSTGT